LRPDTSDCRLLEAKRASAQAIIWGTTVQPYNAPAAKTVRRLEEKFGHVIRETFNIEPTALTADEA
jgi:hypothetical protein